MPSWFRFWKSSPKREPEPATERPGPAQRQLSQECAIENWNARLDWNSLEAQEARLERRLKSYDAVVQPRRPATTEGAVSQEYCPTPRHFQASNGRLPERKHYQGKQSSYEPKAPGPSVHTDVVQQRKAEVRRRTPLNSGLPSPPPVPSRTSSAGRAIPEDERYVNNFSPETPGLTRRTAMRRAYTSATPGTAPYSAPSTPERFLQTPSLPTQVAPTSYPASVPRWLDPHHVEADLVQREAARWTGAGDDDDDPWQKRCRKFTQQVDEEQADWQKPTSPGLVPRVTRDATGTTAPDQASPGDRPDVVFGGEHPAVAYARYLGTQDYRRRRAAEPDLVHPDAVPVDVSWQERTYSGRAVGAAWTKLESERGEHDPVRTSAVPSPLSIQKAVGSNTELEAGGSGMTQSPTDPARAPGSWSYCHVALVALPGRHLRSLDRGCSCQFEAVREQSAAQDQGEAKDVGQTAKPRVHFLLPPHPRYNYPVGVDTSSRLTPTLAGAEHPVDGGSDAESSDSDILAPARARRFS